MLDLLRLDPSLCLLGQAWVPTRSGKTPASTGAALAPRLDPASAPMPGTLMALELRSFGVRANALNPVASEAPSLKSEMGAVTPEVRAKLLASISCGWFSTFENAALFLSPGEASTITGVAMQVDGGRCI